MLISLISCAVLGAPVPQKGTAVAEIPASDAISAQAIAKLAYEATHEKALNTLNALKDARNDGLDVTTAVTAANEASAANLAALYNAFSKNEAAQ